MLEYITTSFKHKRLCYIEYEIAIRKHSKDHIHAHVYRTFYTHVFMKISMPGLTINSIKTLV